MLDIQFDPVAREIVMSDGDFATTTNPSEQNGAALLYGRGFNTTNPMTGVGIEDIIGANGSKMALEMNRWKQMAINDGATISKWSTAIVNNVAEIQQEISYE